MMVYGAASAGVVQQVQRIFDKVLPMREELVATIVTIVAHNASAFWPMAQRGG